MSIYVERDLEVEIRRFLDKKEIIAVVGPRQCGKSTLVNKLLDEIKGKKINRLSFDNVRVLQLFEHDLDSFIELHVKPFDVLFIDEVQYSKDSGKKLKFIYDSFPIKIVVSGSSALELSFQSIKHLVGRIVTFELLPFSFHEFLRAKNEPLFKIYEKGSYGAEILNELNKLLDEFVIYGGYPRVVLADSKEEKEKVLEGIYNTYLLKEVKEILQISDDYAVIKLVKALALQIGNLVNYNELSTLTELNYMNLKKKLVLLEKTYVCKLVLPFSTNKRTELSRIPKSYFFDNGFRNAVLNDYKTERTDLGALNENYVFTELVKSKLEPKYWRSKSAAEVDFIVEKNSEIIGLEVKTSDQENIPKSVYSFIEKYKPKVVIITSKTTRAIRKVGFTNVKIVPLVKLMQIIKEH